MNRFLKLRKLHLRALQYSLDKKIFTCNDALTVFSYALKT
jgi:hypothetical protein